jgi:hypothetical protein
METDTQMALTAEVLEELEALVNARLQGRVRDFRILPHCEGVILGGRASSYYLKQLAQAELMAVCDLTIVANEIQVD